MAPTERPGAPRRRRVLYIQHAGLPGGSAMSLLFTLLGLDRSKWEPVVALIRPNPRVATLYEEHGFRVLPWSGIGTFEHTTADAMVPWSPRDWLRASTLLTSSPRSQRRTMQLVRDVDPDIVHLNSVVLSPSAAALRGGAIPWVWHVREQPASGFLGLRRRWLAGAIRSWPDAAVFLSEADRRAWLGQDDVGTVVHNFVDLDRFKPGTVMSARGGLGIRESAPVVGFFGGIDPIKGIMPLIEALATLRAIFPDLRCLLLGASYDRRSDALARIARHTLPMLGSATWSQRVDARIRQLGLDDVCVRLPFHADVRPFIAAADVVAFPALKPHFPRPAVEAAAMAKPIVASDLDGMNEVVLDGQTGLLVAPGDAFALAHALRRTLSDRGLAERLGRAGRVHAEATLDARVQVARITAIYEALLARTSQHVT